MHGVLSNTGETTWRPYCVTMLAGVAVGLLPAVAAAMACPRDERRPVGRPCGEPEAALLLLTGLSRV